MSYFFTFARRKVRNMRCLFLTPIFILFIFIHSTRCQTQWHQATVLLKNKSFNELFNLGIALDHGHYTPGVSFSGVFTTKELEKIHHAGYEIELTSHVDLKSRSGPTNCEIIQEQAPVYPIPSYYSYGSMGGFLTLSEIYDDLDLMEALYPNLITVRKQIGNFKTVDGNKIYFVKISDNPNIDENEPEVLYTALHHAREPLSMSQMLYFMWNLLENYGRDSMITKLVNNRELFFIPCVNPDGYKYNETTDPQGGGYWRKNRNPNPDDIGTDLNRNYGEGWAYDNDGSSPLGSSETYRGNGAFSEIETKALKEFCITRHFSITMNYHTFGDKLIIPWGYLDKPTEDSTQFLSMAQDMVRYNHFEIGTSSQTLGYKVNGVADDWMYGEQNFKNKTYAFTPEVGYDFWPARTDILRLNQSTQYMNFISAWDAGECAHVKEISSTSISADTNYLDLELTRTGLIQAPIQINLESDKSYIRFLNNNWSYSLKGGETKHISVPYVIDGIPHKGDSITFTANLITGIYTESSKFKKSFTGTANWSEEFTSVKEWFSPTLSPWKLTTESFVTAPNSLTDSPFSPMDANTVKVFQSSKQIDLRNAHYAFLRFNAKWQMADDGEYVQVKVADNSLVFQSLCGRYTKAGSASQVYQEPLYCGKQNDWVSEWINLKDYLGKVLFLEVYLSAGPNDEKNDGFYFDDFEVFTDITTQVLDQNSWNSEVFPQPAHDNVNILLNENKSISDLKYQLISASGKPQTFESVIEKNVLKIKTSSLIPGFYFLSLQYRDENPRLYKVVIE